MQSTDLLWRAQSSSFILFSFCSLNKVALSTWKISCSISFIIQNSNSFSFIFRNVRDQHTDEESEIMWGWFTQDYPLSQMQSLYLNQGLLTASFPYSSSHNSMLLPMPTAFSDHRRQKSWFRMNLPQLIMFIASCVGCLGIAITSSFLSHGFYTCLSSCPIHSHLQFWDLENTAFPVLFYMIRFLRKSQVLWLTFHV